MTLLNRLLQRRTHLHIQEHHLPHQSSVPVHHLDHLHCLILMNWPSTHIIPPHKLPQPLLMLPTSHPLTLNSTLTWIAAHPHYHVDRNLQSHHHHTILEPEQKLTFPAPYHLLCHLPSCLVQIPTVLFNVYWMMNALIWQTRNSSLCMS